MEIYMSKQANIILRDNELETMREILILAHERLNTSPLIQMRGCPLQRQAGLIGADLFRVKKMLEDLGKEFAVSLPYDTATTDE